MTTATKEGTRKQRIWALNGLNAALEDFNESRSRDVIDLNTVRLRMRDADVAYEGFVGWQNKFLDFPCEEAEMDAAQAEGTALFKKINAAKAQFLALNRPNLRLEPRVPLAESTRRQRVQALNHLNAALEDFDGSISRDAINLDTVRLHIRAANIAYGRFVGWHKKFLGLRCEEAELDAAQAESTTAFKKIKTAKAHFLVLKEANSGLEPTVPLAEISAQKAAAHAAGVDPERNASDPHPGSTSDQASS